MNSSKEVLEMFSRDEKPDAWLGLSMLSIMRKRYPPEDERELIETFQKYSAQTQSLTL